MTQEQKIIRVKVGLLELAKQLGNLFAAVNTTLQAGIVAHFHNEFSVGLASVAACVAIIVALLAGFGVEAKGMRLAAARSEVQ